MTIFMTLLAVAVMVLLDQVVKLWAVAALKPMGTLMVLPGVVQLTYVENRGAAFSLLQNQIWLFVLLAVVILVAICYALQKNYIQTMLGRLSLVVIAAGAVGNMLDRVLRHYVVDMIEVTFISFPVFNIADIYVCCGVALFLYYMFVQHKEEPSGELK